MSTSTLAEFLLARIAEDEAAWSSEMAKYTVHGPDCDYPGDLPGICDCNLRRRLLAECETKRRIVEALQVDAARNVSGDFDPRDYAPLTSELVLLLLAVPYADHPDYREEWRP